VLNSVFHLQISTHIQEIIASISQKVLPTLLQYSFSQSIATAILFTSIANNQVGCIFIIKPAQSKGVLHTVTGEQKTFVRQLKIVKDSQTLTIKTY